ncbi:ABC transporter substrate-binding protein [Chthonobacter rhizosphaerae]|uniref:ABC transporter substrate-binding protein n=1 Tax=Chthonobacter rhizosphaerae TaxID=2735553 RepID=UPI0015EE50E1|nr:ABC transporter substrate-binding protein [Chthonobacter rhizosphaerae]
MSAVSRTAAIFLAAIMAMATATRAQSTDFEIFTYWTSTSEAALQEVRKAFEARGGVWHHRSFENSFVQFRELTRLSVAGVPPSVTQWPPGASLRELADVGMIEPIDHFAEAGRWREVLPRAVIDLISYEGRIYLAPVGFHVEHMLWTNKRVLDAHGIARPETLDDLIAAGRVLKAAGVTPIALPKDEWTRVFLIRAVMAHLAGRAPILHRPKVTWSEVIDDPVLDDIMATLVSLRDLVTPVDVAGNWSDAARDLAEGRSAFYVMGDWVRGEFRALGKTIGEDILCGLVPGVGVRQRIVVDGFAFMPTTDPMVRASQALMAEVLMDPAVQLAFAKPKGSVPVRRDADLEALDSCVKDAMADSDDPANAQHQFNPKERDASREVRYYVTMMEALSNPKLDAPTAIARMRAIRDDTSMAP